MAQVELIMPKMGESIMEATILRWVKQVGDTVDVDETVLEIATDKVDSEVPSPVSGKITKILFEENDVVEIGKTIAVIATEGEEAPEASPSVAEEKPAVEEKPAEKTPEPQPATAVAGNVGGDVPKTSESGRFYSPLVRNIAKEENISVSELEQINGSGLNGRVTKKDILGYLENRTSQPQPQSQPQASSSTSSLNLKLRHLPWRVGTPSSLRWTACVS
jgi:2-oxoglutarate dehydrogenase E2 component (dihydrolipoamide succinyltransferase)